MLVEIYSYYVKVILSGRKCTCKQLRAMFLNTIKNIESNDFVSIFCTRFKFEVMPYDEDIEVDFVIDLDTYLVYKPTY